MAFFIDIARAIGYNRVRLLRKKPLQELSQTANSLDRVRAGLLFDMYGALLTDHQQEVWQLYYLDDWSLAEIGEARGISRAAVHDLLDRTHRLLEDYEARLGLLATHERRRTRFQQIREALGAPADSPARTILERWAEEEGLTDV